MSSSDFKSLLLTPSTGSLQLLFFFPSASSNRLLCSPGCQIISPLPAPPRTQLLQKRLAPAHSFLLISLQIKQFAPCRALYSSSIHAVQWESNPTGCSCVATSSHRVQAQREPSQGGLTSHCIYPDNHLDP